MAHKQIGFEARAVYVSSRPPICKHPNSTLTNTSIYNSKTYALISISRSCRKLIGVRRQIFKQFYELYQCSNLQSVHVDFFVLSKMNSYLPAQLENLYRGWKYNDNFINSLDLDILLKIPQFRELRFCKLLRDDPTEEAICLAYHIIALLISGESHGDV